MQKVQPFLWFDSSAEEAASFYTSLFPNSKVTSVSRYGEGGPGPAGSAMVVNFELDGMPVIALNGGPMYQPTEAFSFYINCDSQEEVDRLWDALIANGGEESMCGWLKDRFGLSWQVIPTRLMELMGDPDSEKAQRVMGAMLQMRKIDVPTLEQAHAGE
jgi:predicted 3-demethylubiquinone-9 3-methyltransferase (glyoxalase superfamily)